MVDESVDDGGGDVVVSEDGLGCDDVLGHSLGGVSENECYV